VTFGSPIDTPVIETRSLTKRYGRTGRGVNDLDLDVRAGEVVGFLGAIRS
jgi:ABC-type multidrug transport system ATPase subunit